MKEDEIKNIFHFYKIIQIKKLIERICTKSIEKKSKDYCEILKG